VIEPLLDAGGSSFRIKILADVPENLLKAGTRVPIKVFNPSFSWATGEPHEISGLVPKALQSLQAGISVFLVGKADFLSMPSIW
jgi:hypothetical protein